jgi:hypothetical protein
LIHTPWEGSSLFLLPHSCHFLSKDGFRLVLAGAGARLLAEWMRGYQPIQEWWMEKREEAGLPKRRTTLPGGIFVRFPQIIASLASQMITS